MPVKKVTIAPKPARVPKAATTPDKWVASGKQDDVETTRFTIDIPTELHARIKSECALKRLKMRDAIQALLEQHFPAK